MVRALGLFVRKCNKPSVVWTRINAIFPILPVAVSNAALGHPLGETIDDPDMRF